MRYLMGILVQPVADSGGILRGKPNAVKVTGVQEPLTRELLTRTASQSLRFIREIEGYC